MGIFLFLIASIYCGARELQQLKVKQAGKNLVIYFPKLVNRSAAKLLDQNGNLVKGILIDEGLQQFTLGLDKYKPGLHYLFLENRVQRFSARLMLY